MACCCTNIKELSCLVNVCNGQIQTGINAPATGVFRLVLNFLGVEFVVNSEEILIDTEIVFPAQELNEDYKFTGKILDSNGDVVTTTIDTTVYDCVGFRTGMSYEVNPTS